LDVKYITALFFSPHIDPRFVFNCRRTNSYLFHSPLSLPNHIRTKETGHADSQQLALDTKDLKKKKKKK